MDHQPQKSSVFENIPSANQCIDTLLGDDPRQIIVRIIDCYKERVWDGKNENKIFRDKAARTFSLILSGSNLRGWANFECGQDAGLVSVIADMDSAAVAGDSLVKHFILPPEASDPGLQNGKFNLDIDFGIDSNLCN